MLQQLGRLITQSDDHLINKFSDQFRQFSPRQKQNRQSSKLLLIITFPDKGIKIYVNIDKSKCSPPARHHDNILQSRIIHQKILHTQSIEKNLFIHVGWPGLLF